MPASRSARAMIFAPRSCPSRPGFATTTLIFPATVGQYRNGEADDRRLLSRLAEPGKRPLRIPDRAPRDEAPPRLRPRRPLAAPGGGRMAARRRDRDHAHAHRPLRRRDRVALGPTTRPGAR